MPRPKKIHSPDKMPDDFWNYIVNPIVGYYIGKEDMTSNRILKKYAKPPQGL